MSLLPAIDQPAAECNVPTCICQTEEADIHTSDSLSDLPFGFRALVTHDDNGRLRFAWYAHDGGEAMDDYELQAWFAARAPLLEENDITDEEAFDIFVAYKFGVQNVHEARRSSSPCGQKRKPEAALPPPIARPHPMALQSHIAAPVPSRPTNSPAANAGLSSPASFPPAANSLQQSSPSLSTPPNRAVRALSSAKPAASYVAMEAPAATAPPGQAALPAAMLGAAPASLLVQTASPAAASPAARAAAHVAAKAMGGASPAGPPLGQMSPDTQAAVHLADMAGGGARGGTPMNMAANGMLGALPDSRALAALLPQVVKTVGEERGAQAMVQAVVHPKP